ncbi:ribosomal protein L10 family protein [Tieghemostelium lacteum]|uniref:Ribosome assembly factor mrt4 n=1 Tax=Tieghemostelium lacteum TaxID=361077 RepID=A0A151ZFR7_TIELA|nr:ribosomal protein L10 family protein [Tieghemostelium lacteum]|eukprot:KYQ92822.1 ribosomal protein L10 family protein [Tieghemostelium lacteum]
MAKSKRDKLVSLTHVTKNPNEKKKKLIKTVKENAEKYNNIYILTFENMRNNKLKEVRTEWSTSKLLFGKNKVLIVGLGKGEEDEVVPGIHKLSQELVGECALLFTNEPKEQVFSYFNMFTENDFPRSGYVPKETITRKAGPIEGMTHSMEPYLRNLGLPVVLKNGVIHVDRDYDLCVEGEEINPEQAKLLQLFDHPISEFRFTIKGYFSNGEYTQYQE